MSHQYKSSSADEMISGVGSRGDFGNGQFEPQEHSESSQTLHVLQRYLSNVSEYAFTQFPVST